MEPINLEQVIRLQGYKAFYFHWREEDNPHDNCEWAYEAWGSGWYAAQRDFIENVA